MERQFLGIWIPREIWLAADLTLQEKVFYAEIESLDGEKGCFASNAYFAEFFGISEVRVSQVINSLVQKGFVISEVDPAKGNSRTLRGVLKKSLRPSYKKVYDPLKGKFKNIIKNNNKDISSEEPQTGKEQNPEPRTQPKRPHRLPASAESEIHVWLDALYPLLGAKSRSTIANLAAWRDVVTVAIKEQRELPAFLATVTAELKRNASTPQYFSPKKVLSVLQTSAAIGEGSRTPNATRGKFLHTI